MLCLHVHDILRECFDLPEKLGMTQLLYWSATCPCPIFVRLLWTYTARLSYTDIKK